MAYERPPKPKSEGVAQFLGALHSQGSSGQDSDSDLESGLHRQLLVAGKRIADRYTLRERIGKGGMATVWEAQDDVSRSIVAIKFLGREYVDTPEYRLRFAAEARASAGLRSPFIIHVHDFGLERATPFIAMERLYGVDLHTRLEDARRLPLAAVQQIASDAGAALEVSHAAGIIHRDLKPKNLFLTMGSIDGAPPREIAKLLDFGVAKHEGTAALHTATGVMLGSPFYMSPEQIHGECDVDERADLWSLAAILYRALTGVKAFDGDMTRVMYLITSERHRAPSRFAECKFAEGLGRAVDAFFDKALAKDRDDRFQSAAELVRAFNDIC